MTHASFRPPRRARWFLALLLALAPLAADAAPRTFTARDGRTMEAEILGYKGDTLRVRRSDTGKEFKLAIADLAESDQAGIRAFLRDNPALRDTITPDQIRVEFSRSRFETDRSNGHFYDVNVEHWGYRIVVANLASTPLEGLRVEHLVFARLDPDGVRATVGKDTYERKAGRTVLDTIPVQGRGTATTETIVCRTEKLDGGSRWVTEKGLKSKVRDRALHGVWFRVYDGDKLLHEASSPDSLRTSERWSAASHD